MFRLGLDYSFMAFSTNVGTSTACYRYRYVAESSSTDAVYSSAPAMGEAERRPLPCVP